MIELCFITLQAAVLCSFHVGETVNTLHKTTLIPGGAELLVYTTLSGTVGMMVPFTSREVMLNTFGMLLCLLVPFEAIYCY